MQPVSWQAIPEAELVPYRALAQLPVQRLLVLAPHPDDEVFGCGGLLAIAARQGVEARIVVVSDGAAAGDASVREGESRDAALALADGARALSLEFWRLPDRGVTPDAALVARIRALATEFQPQWLLVPSPFEIHPDHRAVCLAAIGACAGLSLQLGFVEIGQPLVPNVLIDITPMLDRKRAAIACFGSQLALQGYDEQVLALNRFRAYTLGPAVTHAEALWFPPAEMTGSAAAVLDAATKILARRLGLG
jgi:LmbE family N-acetylglucosaminyl deacetylase